MSNNLFHLKPHHKDTFNCVDHVIYNASFLYGADISLWFLERRGFYYGKKTVPGEDLYDMARITSRKEYSYQLLQEYCGMEHVEIIDRTFTAKETLEYVVDCAEEQHLVGLTFDSFYCPWSRSYHSIHVPHSVLIVGYEEKGFLILDGYLSRNIQILPFLELDNTKIYLSFHRERTKRQIGKQTVLKLLDKNIRQYGKYRDMRAFREEIREYSTTNSKDKPSSVDLDTSLFLLYLSGLGWDNINFAYALQTLQDQGVIQRNIDTVAQGLNRQWKNWLQIRGYAMKAVLLREQSILMFEYMYQRIGDIIALEKELDEQIFEILS